MLCVYYDGKVCKLCQGTPDFYVSDNDFSKILSTKNLDLLNLLQEDKEKPVLIGRLGKLKDGIYVESEKEYIPELTETKVEKDLGYYAYM